MKPILHMVDGEVAALEKGADCQPRARPTRRPGRGGGPAAGRFRWPFSTWTRPHAPKRWRRGCQTNCTDVVVCEVGAVMGVHVGPGMVAVAIAPAGIP